MLSPAEQKFLSRKRKFDKFLYPPAYLLIGLCIVAAVFFFSEFTKLESDAKPINKKYLEKMESIEVHSELEKKLQSSLVQEIKTIDSVLNFLMPRFKYLLVLLFLSNATGAFLFFRHNRTLMRIITKLEKNKSL